MGNQPITNRGREWEMANSAWLIWSVIPIFWPIALIYAGSKARRPQWSWAGALYALPMVLSWVTAGPVQNLLHALTGLAWLAALVHALVIRAPYLRRVESMQERAKALAQKVAEAREAMRGAAGGHREVPAWPAPTQPGATAPAEHQAPAGTPAEAAAPTARQPQPPSAPPAMPTTGAVDLNTASVLDLALLPGMNMDLAHRAVRWREQQGEFASLQEFAKAVGLDEQVMASLQSKARV